MVGGCYHGGEGTFWEGGMDGDSTWVWGGNSYGTSIPRVDSLASGLLGFVPAK